MRQHLSSVSSLIFAVALVAAASSCDNDPAKDKVKAEVSQAVAPATPAPKAVGAATKYAFSQANSKFEFVGAKVTNKHDGSFGSFSGAIHLVEGKPEKSSVVADIEMASVSVDDERLTGHLKTPDFFDVAKFPKARFTSTSITPQGVNGTTYQVTGNLELHGITKSISFPAAITVAGDAVDVNAEFAINRKDFGIVYPGAPDDLIKDDVLMRLKLHAPKA
jgi:polyisoprenoid-binding protein YceI